MCEDLYPLADTAFCLEGRTGSAGRFIRRENNLINMKSTSAKVAVPKTIIGTTIGINSRGEVCAPFGPSVSMPSAPITVPKRIPNPPSVMIVMANAIAQAGPVNRNGLEVVSGSSKEFVSSKLAPQRLQYRNPIVAVAPQVAQFISSTPFNSKLLLANARPVLRYHDDFIR